MSAPALEPDTSSPNASGKSGIIVIALLAAAGIGGFAFWKLGSEKKTVQAEASALHTEGNHVVVQKNAVQLQYIETMPAVLGTAISPAPAPGRILVEESRAAPLYAPLSGRIEKVDVQLGQKVKAGQRLVAIRSAALPELGREIETARAALAVRTTSEARVRDLVKLRAVPEKDLLLAEQERREVEITLKAAEGKRKSFHLGAAVDESGLYWLSAPREGTVVERRALVGMEVGPDRAEPLVMVANLDEVIVTADLLEHDVEGIVVGAAAELTAPGSSEVLGRGNVEHVADVVDPARRTVGVRVRVPNKDHHLRPNAFAQVTFLPAQGQRLVVPADAVVTDGQQSVVFVSTPAPDGHKRFTKRPVRLGRTREGRTEIIEGLKPTEVFVSRGSLLLLNAIDLGN